MRLPRINAARELFPWISGAALLVTALTGAWWTRSTHDLAMGRDIADLEDFVSLQIDAWEDGLLADLSAQLEHASDLPTASSRQARLRRNRPWFESLYLWDPTVSQEGGAAPLLFPSPVENSDADLHHRPCLVTASQLTQTPFPDAVSVARAYTDGCRRESPNVRVYASTQAAYWLDNAGLAASALVALESAGIPDTPLHAAIAQGASARRLVVHRLARGELLIKTGRVSDGVDTLHNLARQIFDLDAPALSSVIGYVEPGIFPILRRAGQREVVVQLQPSMRKARRRIAAYEEIALRIMPRQQATRGSPNFIHDQYANPPFLLYYAQEAELGAALQLEQAPLLNDFVSVRMRALQKHVTITDGSGSRVAGAKKGGNIVVSVPFSRTLTHLRVGIRDTALQAAADRRDRQVRVQLVVLGVATALGLLAILASARASRRQAELAQRQRAFATRVTHELKTPLAGIRLMGENLQFGAATNAAARQEMAARIVEEADKLTARVNEVLAVAKARHIPSPEPFDPAEPILEAVATWAPRYEAAGLELHVDLQETPDVVGDASSYGDAIGCLLDNALKYRRTDIDNPTVWLTLSPVGRMVEVCVTDNGIGVPKNMRSSIFQRFVRVESPNRGASGGHGLGLHHVHEITVAHRGRVQCTHGVDGGATFTIRLPAQRGP